MRDTESEHVWSKAGSRIRLPRAPRVSRKTLLVAAAFLAMASLATVGFVAAPAGSPPPPTGVAEPVATVQETPTDTPTPTETPTPAPVASPVEQPGSGWTQPGLSHICKPVGKAAGYMFPAPTSSNAAIAYSDQGSIWVYDKASNTSRLVLPESRQCGYYRPQFYNRRLIAFYNQTYVQLVDTVTGEIRALRTYMNKTDWAWDYAINAKSGNIAVLVSDTVANLKVVVSSMKTDVLYRHKVGTICACDGVPMNLEWSRDGTMLLVSAGAAPQVHVLDLQGREVIPSFDGSDAHWLGSTHSFVFSSVRNGVSAWQRVDVGTGRRTTMFSSSGLSWPVPSPDGTRVAFTDQTDPRVAVYDFTTRKLTVLRGSHAYPLWLGDDTIVFSGATRCNCEYPDFTTTGAVGALSLSTGRWTRMNMTDTIDAQVVF